MTLKTEFQREKEKRDYAIYSEFVALSAQQGAAITEVTNFLMRKYGIHSASTLWAIRKRVSNRIKAGGAL